MTYHYNCNGFWFWGAVFATAFVSPWCFLALWPFPAHWGKYLPATYTKSKNED